MPRPVESDDEALMHYMVPGSTLDDLVSTTSEEAEGDYDCVELVKTGHTLHVVPVAGTAGAAAVSGGAASPAALAGANPQQEPTSIARFQPAQHQHFSAKVLSRIHIEGFGEADDRLPVGSGAATMNQRVLNELSSLTMNAAGRAGANAGTKKVDRSERATVENVMDPRTRLILYKLVNTGILREINGCVSTGKEANVYYAVCGDGSAAALKVFKTSILVFRDRDQYVAGEFRFQRYCKSNPRKMVRTWAEKEARNLCRLQEGGVLAPAVKLLRQHVLVMEFLGEDGWPAPRLKEVRFPSAAALDRCYLDLCCTMRKMFARCKLIHGDLSEYNLLLFRGRVVVIDVSQSVESDHPRAMDFLRRDIVNVHSFFRGKGHSELFSHRDLYDFITAPPSAGVAWARSQGADNTEEMMEHLRQLRAQRAEERAAASGPAQDIADAEEQARVDEQVFLNITVPRTLKEVSEANVPNADVAAFVEQMTAPQGKNKKKTTIATTTTAAAAAAAATDEAGSVDGDEASGSEEEGDDEEEDDDEEKAEMRRRNRAAAAALTLANMTKEERKAHKKNVKAERRERRVEKKKNKASHKKS